jgi:hypothetical protein
MKEKSILIATMLVTAVLVAATAVFGTDSAFADKSQETSQVNDCGNGDVPDGILCETLSSEIWGDDNVVNIFGGQEDD